MKRVKLSRDRVGEVVWVEGFGNIYPAEVIEHERDGRTLCDLPPLAA
jgi:hypothetical protein